MRHLNRLKLLLVFFLISAVLLFTAEAAIRLFFEPPSSGPPLHRVYRDQPAIYALNPGHPEISPQGFRDEIYAESKPPGQFRILLLGDSVTYGLFVSAQQPYGEKLERLMKRQEMAVEVLNGGVNGYSPYNELHFYLWKGWRFRADLVLVGFCLNDLVNPVPHWGEKKKVFQSLPDAAFPDPRLMRQEAEAFFAPRPRHRRFLEHSALHRFISARWRLYRRQQERYRDVDGRRRPVYIADESDLTIDSVLQAGKPARLWLRDLYERLQRAASEDGSRFAAIYIPLAYETLEDYPFSAAGEFMQMCREADIPCYNATDKLRNSGGPSLYMQRHRYHSRDIWHLNERGHKILAEGVFRFLQERGLLEGRPARRAA